MRILTVASGKGGVGKTTFALNLALTLARHKKALLLDLDAGTSSLRNFLGMPVEKDIYHFLKKDHPIETCVTTLNHSLDPERLFRDFGFIASPHGYIHDIVNYREPVKEKLIRGINALKPYADYLVIDLKAGLDANVIDFLPITNTGILIFTPRVKAAAATAAEMVKAALSRIFHLVLTAPNGPDTGDAALLAADLDRFEQRYDRDPKSFDDFLERSEKKIKKNLLLKALKGLIENYRVYFVLNQFDSIKESMDDIIKPFVEKVHGSVSPHIAIHNLGWVIHDREIKKSGEYGLPYILMQHYKRKRKALEEERWESYLREKVGLASKKPAPPPQSTPDNEVARQLSLLNKMYVHGAARDPETNFDLIAERIKGVTWSTSHDCGMKKILSPGEITAALLP